jgi:Holliday junction resolvasome RuvABC endonuclease subunit
MIFAIDPGTTQSGWVLLESGKVVDSGVSDNHDVLRWVKAGQGADLLAIEMIAGMGMTVGRETFETVRWIGRFQQAWADPEAVRLVYRRDVKQALCGSQQAKDKNIRQALLDLIGKQGTKMQPGPTYGVSSHAWSALAVAVLVEPGRF